MLSEEKIVHIVHLMIDGIWKSDMVDYPDEDESLREAKRIALKYIGQMNSIGETVTKRIESQQKPPLPHSPQWDVLYQKYYAQELKKHGG